MKKFLLSIFAVLFAFAGVQAQSVIYTLTPESGSNNAYAGSCDITIDEITWNLTGNSTVQPWRMGGKNLSKVDRALYSKTPMNGAVDKVVLTIGTMTSITVNSAKLLVADNVDFKGATEVAFTAKANSSIDIPVSAASGSYFKFLFNVTVSDTKNNRFIQIGKVEFYGPAEEGGETPEPDEPETPVDGPSWTLVEKVSDINAGDEVIIAAATANVALGALKDTYHTSVAIERAENAITNIGDAIVLTVGKNGDNYTFSYDGKYLYWTSSNTLKTTTTVNENSSWIITTSGGVATIKNVGDASRILQYNASSPRFACYTSNQQKVKIYKKTEVVSASYTLSVTDAGYATLYLGFPATIPAGVEAYTVTGVETGYVTLTQVEGVLPANTGVIIKATEDDYTFAYSKETATVVEGNLLEGTVAATEIEAEAYVLGNVDGVGLYKADMKGGAWLNNANKAYLPASKVPVAQGAASFSFRFGEGTTGIDEITDNREQSTVIYDLTGRRVEEVTAPGIYIINGKKVLVK